MNYPSYADFVATRPVYRLFGRVYKAGNNTWQNGNAATNEPNFELSDGDFALNQNTISVESGGSAPFGNAVCRTATLTLVEATKYESADFVGACIYVYAKAYTGNTSGSTFIPFGADFFVTEVVHESGVIKITAQDAMCKADKPFEWTFTGAGQVTLLDLYNEVINQIWGVSSFSGENFTHSWFPPDVQLKGYTCRQVLGFIAQIACGNAMVSGLGVEQQADGVCFPKIEIRTLSNAEPYNTLNQWISLENYSEDIQITGIRALINFDHNGNEIKPPDVALSNPFSDDYAITVSNPLLERAEITMINYMGSKLNGLTFHKFKGKHIGYPLAEYGDYALVTHRGGTFNTFLTNITWNISGATEFECNIDTAAENAADYDNSNGTIEKIEDEEPTTQVFDKPTTFNSTAAFNGAASFADAVTFDGSVKLSNGAELHGEVEVYGDTPHIDFHHPDASTEEELDHTVRLIENTKGRLNILSPNGFCVNGKRMDNQAVTLTANTSRISNVSYTAKYNELLGAVFVRIYGKISAALNAGYDYDLFAINSRPPDSNAALSVKCGKNAMALAKTSSSGSAIQIRPLESGINGYDVYITGFWFV